MLKFDPKQSFTELLSRSELIRAKVVAQTLTISPQPALSIVRSNNGLGVR